MEIDHVKPGAPNPHPKFHIPLGFGNFVGNMEVGEKGTAKIICEVSGERIEDEDDTLLKTITIKSFIPIKDRRINNAIR